LRPCVAAITLFAVLAARAGSLPRSIVDRVAASCVLIQAVEGKGGSAGSGFFVGRNEVLTNYHVVKNAAEGDAKVVLVMGTNPRNRKLANAEVVAGNEALDLALLRTDRPSAHILRFASERALRLTQPVWVAGFPFGAKPGLEVTLTTGTISALRHDDDTGRLRQVQLDAAVNPGNSGGPVVDERGNVVAVTVATVKPAVGSGMALAIPCGAAEAFLKQGRRARHRTTRLHVTGRLPVRNVRITRSEKVEEIWGTSLRITLRSTRDTDELATLPLEVLDRRRKVLARGNVEVGALEARKEKTVSVRLRGVGFDDVAACRIAQ